MVRMREWVSAAGRSSHLIIVSLGDRIGVESVRSGQPNNFAPVPYVCFGRGVCLHRSSFDPCAGISLTHASGLWIVASTRQVRI